MELKKGSVVLPLAGHDKRTFQVVVDFDDKYAMVCDGKYRLLEKPKKKNLVHLKVTNTVLSDTDIISDQSIKRALKPFNESLNATAKLCKSR